MFAQLKRDVRVVMDRDPAAKSFLEVVCCYPGLHAIWLHRIAHVCISMAMYCCLV